MLLNADKIKEYEILSNIKDTNFGNASYDLTVGTIITMDDDVVKEFHIPPQGMVVAISNEIFKVPKNIIGFTTIKNALSSKGILALNIGLVDPTWEGPISSVLINFGRKSVKISENDNFLRMTFFEFELPEQEKTYHLTKYSATEYEKNKRKEARAYFDETFLNLKTFEKDITSKVRSDLFKFVGFTALCATGIAFIINIYLNTQKYAGVEVEKIKNRIECDSLRNNLQINKLDSLARIIDSLKKTKTMDTIKR